MSCFRFPCLLSPLDAILLMGEVLGRGRIDSDPGLENQGALGVLSPRGLSGESARAVAPSPAPYGARALPLQNT